MKKGIRFLMALCAFSTAILAQSIAGTWKGTLQAGPPGQARAVRIVIKITGASDEDLKATLYNIEVPSPGANAGSVKFRDSKLKIDLPAMGGGYEAALSSDGNSLNGAITVAGGQTIPFNLTRATPDTAWTIPEPPPAVPPMAANATPAFEAATIKPAKPGTQGKLITMRGREVVVINMTLADMMSLAYRVHLKQIVNAPAWFDSDHFDINGVPDTPGQAGIDQMYGMLQKLLADRFQLAFHRDKRELSVYKLTVAKSGSKLTKSQMDPQNPPALMFTGLGTLPARNAGMADFAGVMQSAVLDEPVVDATGLSGKWDFTLRWTPDATQFIGLGGGNPPPPNPDGPPDLFTAMQQQLGLKLESAKMPTEVLVIDKVEKPSDN